jgi:D-alanyl-lipoteichoic acid acyltransferase DltB (MBOAT superfamily)
LTLFQIGALAIIAAAIGRLGKGRQLALLTASAFVVFWLQPGQPFVTLQFWMPVATLAITVAAWALTSSPEARAWKENWPAGAVLIGVVLVMDLNRYFRLETIFITGTPLLPLALGAIAGAVAATLLFVRWQRARPFWLVAMLIGLVAVLIFLKTPAWGRLVPDLAASHRGQDTGSELPALSWLGYSYLAFRLMHTIRDRQSGRLPAVALGEYVNYALFFPAFTQGPIDRAERFVKELRAPIPLQSQDWLEAGTRLFIGLFKKFVLADLLSVIALSDLLVANVKTSGWMWVFLYAYALRIYFDFSGYTDIALGIGRLLGIRLPENFAAPYLKPNLTQFWNSWHMSLTQWFRTYFFNPLTRSLLADGRRWPSWLIIFVAQICTMVLIGLWHGISVSFAIWGLWHGLGLFIQNRWSEFVRPRLPAWAQSGVLRAPLHVVNVFLTFNYVALGWLFFNLSTPEIAWRAMLKLMGRI